MISSAELVGALCTVLAFASAGQILITGVLSFEFPHFLTSSHCHLATASGVVSGLVAVPMVIQLKTAQISHHIELKYGYTKWYQVLAILVCGMLHLGADVFAITSLATPRNWNEEFLSKMKLYNEKNSAKTLVDNVQWALQCCGAKSYEDWSTVPWMTKSDSRVSRNFEFIQPSDPETAIVNAVPFSCCARHVLEVCLHYNLLQYGVNTISTQGCAIKVQTMADFILWIEFAIYSLCIVIETVILVCLFSANKDENKFRRNELVNKYLFKRKKVNSIKERGEQSVERIREPEKPMITE